MEHQHSAFRCFSASRGLRKPLRPWSTRVRIQQEKKRNHGGIKRGQDDFVKVDMSCTFFDK